MGPQVFREPGERYVDAGRALVVRRLAFTGQPGSASARTEQASALQTAAGRDRAG